MLLQHQNLGFWFFDDVQLPKINKVLAQKLLNDAVKSGGDAVCVFVCACVCMCVSLLTCTCMSVCLFMYESV